jgi:hypothetical protein
MEHQMSLLQVWQWPPSKAGMGAPGTVGPSVTILAAGGRN